MERTTPPDRCSSRSTTPAATRATWRWAVTMASLQSVGRGFESVIEAALLPYGVPAVHGNQFTDDVGNLDEFAVLSLAFGETTEVALAGQLQNVRGVLVVELYTRKGEGPGRSQEVLASIMRALNALESGSVARITGMEGPSFSALTDRPHFQGRLACSIRAQGGGR